MTEPDSPLEAIDHIKNILIQSTERLENNINQHQPAQPQADLIRNFETVDILKQDLDFKLRATDRQVEGCYQEAIVRAEAALARAAQLIRVRSLQVFAKFSDGRHIEFSREEFARLADGCAVQTLGETSVMVTTVSKSYASGTASFVSLTVDYGQEAAAAGPIPTNFLRRELGQTERDILRNRLIDRSLRPLLPEYNYESQVMCNMLAVDGSDDSDVLSIIGASAALAVSDIPWNGPIDAVRLGIIPWNGPIDAVRLGMIDNEVVINPTRRQIQESSLNLIVIAAHQNLVVMLEGSAENILEQDMKKALKAGVKECQNIINAIEELRKKAGKEKRIIEPPPALPEDVVESVKSLSEMKLRDIFLDYSHNKLSRDTAISNLKNQV